MEVLVTGGHGFVGSHLVARLIERGDRVRCLYRRAGRPAALEGLEVEVAPGDLRRADGLRRAVAGVERVYHLAALTRGLSLEQLVETNTRGTVRLLEAAAEAGFAGRFVFCSSLSAAGPAPRGGVLTEVHAPAPIARYGESKRRAEVAIAARDWPFSWTVLRPPAVYGPRDADFLRLFRSAAAGLVPLVGRPGKRYSLIHAADLARALIAAGDAEAATGRTYFVAHPRPRSQEEMAAEAERAVGRSARRFRLPASALRLVGRVTDVLAQATARPSLLGSDRVAELVAADWVCSPARFMAETGWRPQLDLAAGFDDTVRWYRERGWIP